MEGSGWETEELPVHGALVLGPCCVGFYCLEVKGGITGWYI